MRNEIVITLVDARGGPELANFKRIEKDRPADVLCVLAEAGVYGFNRLEIGDGKELHPLSTDTAIIKSCYIVAG